MTRNTKPKLGTRDDAVLVYSAKQGDMTAFEELIKRHTAMIFRIAMRIVGSREDAEDIVQDAAMKAFQHLHRFEERALFSTWLTRIAVNEALVKLRRSRRMQTISIGNEVDDGLSPGDRIADQRPNPEQHFNAAQLCERLQEALVLLPDNYRVVFLSRDVEGLSIADTAGILGLSIPSVKARLRNARLKLRQSLSPYSGYSLTVIKPSSMPKQVHSANARNRIGRTEHMAESPYAS
jgi:RNA polymerase sigma-70 factor (ECF subfamily)